MGRNDKELVNCTKDHIELLFQLKKYDSKWKCFNFLKTYFLLDIIKECNKLRSLGYDIENDEELLLLEA
jgi:hypothetical protein